MTAKKAARHLEHLRHPEVQNLRDVLLGDEDVGWLDVAMDDALLMRGFQPRRNLDRDLQPVRRSQPKAALGKVIAQGLALQQLHGDERLAFVLVKFINRADVGVVQRRNGFALRAQNAREPSGRRRLLPAGTSVLRPTQLQVFGAIDQPHAAAADDLQHAVVRDDLPRQATDLEPGFGKCFGFATAGSSTPRLTRIG